MPFYSTQFRRAALLALAIFVIALLAFAAFAIDHHGYNRAAALYTAQIAAEHTALEKAAQTARNAAQLRRNEQEQALQQATAKLASANQHVDALTNYILERKHAVSTQYRPQPGQSLVPVPAAVITHGWVCDYNRATLAGSGALPETDATAGSDDDPACQADPFSASAVTPEHILGHHIAYAAYCSKIELQRDQLLDYFEFLENQK